MQVALLTDVYPPRNTHGIARQRHVLARALARQGHDVLVLTLGPRIERVELDGVQVQQLVADRVLSCYAPCPGLDPLLTRSQLLYEGLARFASEADIVDAPLWNLQGFVSVERARQPVVCWLQTTSAHLTALRGGQASAMDRAMQALERRTLAQASAWLADSHAVLRDTRTHYRLPEASLSGVVHLGLPPLEPAPGGGDRHHPWIEALVVGRLEQRKGTQLLLDCLPELLRRHPTLVVRIVGEDNSRADGWFMRTGTDYPTALRRACAFALDRLILEGHVTDERLEECYRQADLVLAPSLYESFGLVYLEAMRAGVPVVAFAAGAAPEIFPRGERDGALLTPIDPARFGAAADAFIESSDRRLAAGAAGATRFADAFTADHMAERTAAFYSSVIQSGRRPHIAGGRKRGHVYQVAEALESADGVGNIIRRNALLLEQLGQPRRVIGQFCSAGLEQELLPTREAFAPSTAGLLFHYWGYNTLGWMAHAFRGRKALYYHNVTPPDHWPADSAGFRRAMRAYKQLAGLADAFDLMVAVSHHNMRDLAAFLSTPKPGIVLYPIIARDEIDGAPLDEELLARLTGSGEVNVVFVGRIAPNKRQDQVMRAFDHYWRHVNRHARLWLVGNTEADPAFMASLQALKPTLPSRDRIMFTGRVPDAAVHAYYRGASVFLCASEHEGFCLPIAHAMAVDVPVIALARCAVPETLGEGLSLSQWDVPRVAELLHLVTADAAVRERVLAWQRRSLARFSRTEAHARLSAILAFLQDGRHSPLFEPIAPAALPAPAATRATAV